MGTCSIERDIPVESKGPGTKRDPNRKEGVGIVNIPERLWNEILLHLERELPCEGVGVLVVSTQEKGDADFRYIPLKNTADDETHFRVEPAEWVSLLHEIEDSGERVYAIVHSHPAAPPEPSEEDRRSFYYPEVSMLIVSFQNRENPEARLYKQQGRRFEHHPCVPVKLW